MNEKALMRKTKAELLKMLKARGKKADPKALKKNLVKLIKKSEPAPKKAAKKKPKATAAKTKTTRQKTATKKPSTAAQKKVAKKKPKTTAGKTPTTQRKKPAKKPLVAAAPPITRSVAPADASGPRQTRDVEVQRPAEVSLPEALSQQQADKPFAARCEQPAVAPQPADVSSRYGEDRITLMMRDPYWIFAYWEVTPQGLEHARCGLDGDGEEASVVLRVYDVDGIEFTGENANSSHDIEVGAEADNWYINTGNPGRTYCVDIGLLGREGSFRTIARSQCVSTPRATPSDKVDDRWMSPEGEFEQVYALSGGFETGAASPDLHELMERQLQARISS